MAYDRYATEFSDNENRIYGVMDAEAREEVSNVKSDFDNGQVYSVVNQRQFWNPFEVVYGARYYCDGTYETKSDYCYIKLSVEEGKTYYFATPDSTSSSGKKTGTAHYVCPVKSDQTYYYDSATAVTWTDRYTVPTGANISSLIVSIPTSRLGDDGLYSISSDPLSSANKYSPRFAPSFGTIAERVSLTNLLDETTWTNEYVSVVNGNVTANDGYRTSNYIPVTAGNYLVSTQTNQRIQMFSCAVYNSSKTVIPGESVTGDGNQRQSGYFKLPQGAAYIRVTYTTSNFSTENFLYQYRNNIGYVTKDFYVIKEAAMQDVVEKIDGLETAIKSKWYGKKFLAIGDSQTAQGKWQPFVESVLGMTAYTKGFSGRTVAVSNPNNTGDCISSDYNIGQIESFINDGHDDFDVVLIMGGTNDWGYDGVIHEGYANILIGTNEDTVNTTFKGALKKLVKHFNDTYPTKTVVIMSNIGGRTRDPATDTILTNMTTPLINANGYCQATFAQAAKEIAEYIGVPFIDVFSCGITIYNSATYLEDGLHINSGAGAKAVSNAVINGLQRIQPYNE